MIKLSFYFIFASCIIFSCSDSDVKNTPAFTNVFTNKPEFKKLDTIIPFSGYWINEEYYNSIQEYKSPEKAQDGAEFIFIPDKTLKSTMMISNFHEGGSFLTVVKNKDRFQLWTTENDTLIEKTDDIQTISLTKIKIGNKFFIKINPLYQDPEYLILEEILFKGKYITNNGTQVELKNNGDIVGLSGFTFYRPNIDYYGPGLEIDQITMGNSKKDSQNYSFKFNKDTLEFYKINCEFYYSDKTCINASVGKLVFKLIRKKESI